MTNTIEGNNSVESLLKQGFFFWRHNEGGINAGWCIFGGNHSYLLEKGLCR
jgi:hypothetical protein